MSITTWSSTRGHPLSINLIYTHPHTHKRERKCVCVRVCETKISNEVFIVCVCAYVCCVCMYTCTDIYPCVHIQICTYICMLVGPHREVEETQRPRTEKKQTKHFFLLKRLKENKHTNQMRRNEIRLN